MPELQASPEEIRALLPESLVHVSGELTGGSHPTTLRGGWGLFYIQPFARLYNNFVQNAPFSPSVQLNGVTGRGWALIRAPRRAGKMRASRSRPR